MHNALSNCISYVHPLICLEDISVRSFKSKEHFIWKILTYFANKKGTNYSMSAAYTMYMYVKKKTYISIKKVLDSNKIKWYIRNVIQVWYIYIYIVEPILILSLWITIIWLPWKRCAPCCTCTLCWWRLAGNYCLGPLVLSNHCMYMYM